MDLLLIVFFVVLGLIIPRAYDYLTNYFKSLEPIIKDQKDNVIESFIDEIEKIVPANTEYAYNCMGENHIIEFTMTPLATFSDKGGMTYDEFKNIYPTFVKWIEENGFVYNSENDQSLKKME